MNKVKVKELVSLLEFHARLSVRCEIIGWNAREGVVKARDENWEKIKELKKELGL